MGIVGEAVLEGSGVSDDKASEKETVVLLTQCSPEVGFEKIDTNQVPGQVNDSEEVEVHMQPEPSDVE